MEITTRHWLVALLIAGLAHAALALALVHQSAPQLASAPGISIELGGGGQPGAAADGTASGPAALQPVESPEPSVSVLSESPLVDPKDSARAADTLVGARIPEVAPEEIIVAKAVPRLKPKPPKEPRLTSQSNAEQRKTRAREAITSPNRSDPPAKPASATSATAKTNTRPPPSALGSSASTPERDSNAPDRSGPGGGRGRTGASDARGNRRGGAAGADDSGNEASASNYYGRLATWLARHKRYPIQARRLRQEGIVKVTFTIASNGRVVSKRVTQSSGHELLDREVQAMLERASPLPRIPSSLGRSSLTITLPVAFNLR